MNAKNQFQNTKVGGTYLLILMWAVYKMPQWKTAQEKTVTGHLLLI